MAASIWRASTLPGPPCRKRSMPRAASRSRAMLWYSKHLLRLHRRMPSPAGMGFLAQFSVSNSRWPSSVDIW